MRGPAPAGSDHTPGPAPAHARGFGAKSPSRLSPRTELLLALPSLLLLPPPSLLLLARAAAASAMIGQRTLHSFFSAAPAKKRSRSPQPGGDAEVENGDLLRSEERRSRGGERLWD